MPYTKPTLIGYNADPPPDNGEQTAANMVSWSKHLEKIGNPLRAYIDAVNNQAAASIGNATTSVATIAELQAIQSPQDGLSAVVLDQNRGGLFVFRTAETGAGDGGIKFKADDSTVGSWVRQYSGPAMLRWFPSGDKSAALQGLLLAGDVSLAGGAHTINGTVTIFPESVGAIHADGGSISLGSSHHFTSSASAERWVQLFGDVFPFMPKRTNVRFVQRAANTVSRSVAATFDSVAPTAWLEPICELQKLRTDYLEFSVRTAVAANGIRFARWVQSHRGNPGTAGCARILTASQCALYATDYQSPKAFDSGDRSGTWTADTWTLGDWGYSHVRAVNTAGNANPATVTYTTSTGTTRISLRHFRWTNGGIISVVVKDSGDTEIPSENYEIPFNGTEGVHEIDTYWVPGTTAANPSIDTRIADRLPPDTYTVEITVTNRKNASSEDYRYYDFGFISADTREAGVVGDDAWDDLVDLDGRNYWLRAAGSPPRSGNLEYAVSVRTPESSPGAENFVTGTHGNETGPTGLQILADGVDITSAYNAAAGNARWYAREFRIKFDTEAFFHNAPATKWADITYSYTYSAGGVVTQVDRVVTAPAAVHIEYVGMLHFPDASQTDDDPAFPVNGVGGGYPWLALDGDNVFSVSADNSVQTTHNFLTSRAACAFNSEYGVMTDCINHASVVPGAGRVGQHTIAVTRTDTSAKYYVRTLNESAGAVLPIGHRLTARARYRVAFSPGLSSLLGVI